MANLFGRPNRRELVHIAGDGSPGARLRPSIVKGFLRLGGTFLIAGAGLLMIVDALVALRAHEILLLPFAVPVAMLWLGAGSLMIRSLVREACWDEDALYLAFAFETRVVSWSDVLAVRVLTTQGWPTRSAAAFVLLSYRTRFKGRQKRSWALLTVSQDRATSR
jgi:hypothetical protein